MCLILFGYKISDHYPLILAANRDEFYHRPAQSMRFWEDAPDILAGRDLEKGGTWLGVHRDGRFAALTNYRNPAALKSDAPSRGEVIVDFLMSGRSAEEFIHDFQPGSDLYNGFNLILGSLDQIWAFSNVSRRMEPVRPGIHGLSNRFLDTPWPKVDSGKKALGRLIRQNQINRSHLFDLLNDRSIPADHHLPNTGVGLEWERILSSCFIESETYGTRSSIVMTADRSGNIRITERTYSPEDRRAYADLNFHITGNLVSRERN